MIGAAPRFAQGTWCISRANRRMGFAGNVCIGLTADDRYAARTNHRASRPGAGIPSASSDDWHVARTARSDARASDDVWRVRETTP